MKSATQILKSKSEQSVYTVTPATSVFDAVMLMEEKNIGALVVMADAKVVGIITEREFARRVVLAGLSAKHTPVRDVMTAAVMYVQPDQTNEECMALMTDNRVRHLPVMDNGELVGLISIGDLVKDIISKQQFTIEQLEHYITGDLR